MYAVTTPKDCFVTYRTFRTQKLQTKGFRFYKVTSDLPDTAIVRRIVE